MRETYEPDHLGGDRERITGLARVLRANATTAVENVALWHERDISHSGAERVILPDSTILLDYIQHLAIRVVRGMVVHEDRMRDNLDLTCGALFSQWVLLALVEGGMQRDAAYRVVQELAQRAWDERVALRELLEQREDLELDLDAIFDVGHYTRHAQEIVGRLGDGDARGFSQRSASRCCEDPVMVRGTRRCIAGSIALAAVVASIAGCSKSAPGSDQAQVRRGLHAIEGIPQDGFTLGRPQAPWTLTVISDATSYELDQLITLLPALVTNFVRPGSMKLQLRTPSIGAYAGNGDERVAASALLAAGLQRRYWNAVARFVPTYRGRLSDADVKTLLQRSGVPDVSRAMAERSSPRVRAALARADAAAATAVAAFPATLGGGRVVYLLTHGDQAPRNVTADVYVGQLIEVLDATLR